MSPNIRPKLSYANVVSTLCLFLLLGGGAYAAIKLPKNSVGTKQLKKSAVTAAKIKNRAITGPKIKLSTLGTVPSATRAATAADADHAGDADTLQGKGAGAFVGGNGRLLNSRRDLQIGDEVEFFALPGIGAVTATCLQGTTKPAISFAITNNSGAIMDQTLEYPGGVDSSTVPNGKAVSSGSESFTARRMKVSTRTSPSTVATVDFSFVSDAPAPCGVYAQAIVSG